MLRTMAALGSISLFLVAGCGAGAQSAIYEGAALAGSKGEATLAAAADEAHPRSPDGPLTAEERDAALKRLLEKLDALYIFPEKAKLVRKSIEARQKRGEYDKLLTGHAFTKAISSHVNEILKDAHFRVFYSAERIPEDERQMEPTPAERERFAKMGRMVNGGFERVERLPGNIGYLEVRSFGFVERGVEAAAAAMTFLADTDALIIDLRRNGGGEPELVAALCSYFFDGAVHVNDIHDRPKNETRQYWTSPTVPGKRYLGKDVYVLTSKRTASGAEEFAYDLQTQKRAVLIGETTWGGANPGQELRLADHLSAFIPTGRAENPITKTNWEGTGVKPDVAVEADDALRVAQIRALKKNIQGITDPDLKKSLEQRLEELEAGTSAKAR